MNKEMTRPNSNRWIRKPLRIGFLPLVDCAPLVMAHELGLFEKYRIHRHHANEPSDDKAAWIVSQLVRAGLLKEPGHVRIPAARDVFRLDIFDRAKTCLIGEAKKITAEFNNDETPLSAETINLIP